MDGPQESPRISIPQLCDILDQFISRSCCATDDSERWLADTLRQTLMTARRVRATGLSPEDKASIKTFLLAEIADKRAEKQKEIEDLDVAAKEILEAA